MSGLDDKLNEVAAKAQAKVDHYKGLILKQNKLSKFHEESLQVAVATLHLIKIIDRLREQRNFESGAGAVPAEKYDGQLEMEFQT